jgi:dynein heavy chain
MSDAFFNAQDVDLSIQIAVEALNDGSAAEFPMDVLRGVIGEAVYGGKLSDDFDGRVNQAYLATIFSNDIFHDTAAVAGIQMPNTSTLLGDYDRYIDEAVPQETPAMYGLASNASMEISAVCSNRVCEAVMQFVTEDKSVSAARYDAYELAKSATDDMIRKLPESFNMTNLAKSSEEVVSSTQGPYVLVALQECTRMNEVLVALKRALEELRRGLLGQVSLTAEMEAMAQAFNNNVLPGSASCAWARHSWLPRASLKGWFESLVQRHSQLQHWVDKFETPHCLWMGGLVSPRAMLVAMKQVASRATNVAASSLAIEAHVTTFTRPEQCKEFNVPHGKGLLITGLHLEGSKWSAVEVRYCEK